MVKNGFADALLYNQFGGAKLDVNDIVLNQFGGLDSLDNPASLLPFQAQDLLNVLLQPGMAAVYKRDGYGLYQSLPINTSTTAVHGAYHFQQLNGSDVQLFGNDVELSASVSDGSFVRVATGTAAATWQCTDNLGFAYCVTSAGDTPVKTDGTAANTSYQPSIPNGSIITSSPLRLVVSDTTTKTTIDFSATNNFTNFTYGVLNTSAFQEQINAPGSRITNMGYYFGRLFWWTDNAFGYISGDFSNQYSLTIYVVSNQIGTLDNSSAFWNSSGYDAGTPFAANIGANETPSGIFFRGQDNQIYMYDGYNLTRISRIIAPTLASDNRKKANSWTQNSQANFQNGTNIPAANISETIQPGSVIVSSFGATENSNTQWNNGTVSNITINVSSLTLSTNNLGNLTNPDFESSFSGNWSESDDGALNDCIWAQHSSLSPTNCTISPQHGSSFAGCRTLNLNVNSSGFLINLMVNGIAISTLTLTTFNDCTWRQATFTDTADTGKRVSIRLVGTNTTHYGYLTTSDSYIWPGSMTLYYASDLAGSGAFSAIAIDNVQGGSSTITSGSFTSQTYNTGFTSATYSLSNFAWTANTSTPTFSLQTSAASNGPWTTLVQSSATNAIGNQYARYISTISIGSGDNALTSISAVSVIAVATGTYYSAVNNAPNLTTWGTFNVSDFVPGNSAVTYYTRASTNSFTQTQSTPTWVLQGKNATVTASTGTFMQMRADFSVTAATETPYFNSFTFNWTEGSAADKAYFQYFNDAIWISLSSGTISSNDVIVYFDLLNSSWLQFNFGSDGFLVENNNLYFGDPLQGRIFKFGGVTTDNGNPINSYWKSKDFTGADPTVQNEYQQADFIIAESSTTMTYTYTLDQKTATILTFPAFDANSSILKRGFLLAPGKIGTFYNFKFGDNSSASAWRLMMHKIHFNPLYWKPQNS